MATVCTTPEDHLLAPVAEEVGSQIRCSLGRIARLRGVDGIDILFIIKDTACAIAIPFLQIRTVMVGDITEKFILQVAIPVDTEIIRGIVWRNGVTADSHHAALVRSPEFKSPVVGINIRSHATTSITATILVVKDFTCPRIT